MRSVLGGLDAATKILQVGSPLIGKSALCLNLAAGLERRREPSMRVLHAAALIILLTGPAYAQMETPHINLLSDTPTKTEEEIEKEQTKDKAYRESLKKIPDAKASSDPWGGVRNADAPKAPAKTTAAKAKAKAPN
jgi:hypothetical protein